MKKYYKALLLIIVLTAFILRFYKLSENPPGLYIDEASIGYNAYKILTTGKDEFDTPYPMFFKSFGDYKMPVYIYATSLSMSVFGKNEFAVRFPSAFMGSLTILLFYLFIKKALQLDNLFKEKREVIALLSAFLLAITPWQLQFSRGGFENNAALFIFMLGFVLALYFYERKRFILLLGSFALFAASMYTYHTYRIFAPIAIFTITSFSFIIDPPARKKTLLSVLVFAFLALPLLIFSFSPQGSARFTDTSAFSELGSKLASVRGLILYPFTILKNYLTYFSFYFLFDTGDGIGRHQIPNFGPLFKWQLPFLLMGFYSLVKLKSKFFKPLIIILILISPLPASLVLPSPQTLRSLLMVIPMLTIISLGIIYFYEKISMNKYKKYLISGIVLVVVFELIFYQYYYFVSYPRINQLDWGGGYKETVYKIEELRKNYDEVIIDQNLSFLQTYYKFYTNKQSPKQVTLDWIKPLSWKNKKVLYIRPFYGSDYNPHVVADVFLPNNSTFIFAQFWSL